MIKTLKTKTARGGWKQDVATAWNTKLTTKRKPTRYKGDVPAEILRREVDHAYHAFWAKRRTMPDAHPL